MKEMLKRIQHLSADNLQTVMKAIEQRYAKDFPEWDVYYLALHKDPELRAQEIAAVKERILNPPLPEESKAIPFPVRK